MKSAWTRYLAGLVCTIVWAASPPLASFSYAQPALPFDDCAGGTLFYIAFPEPVANIAGGDYTPVLLNSPSFSLMIYSPVEQQVKISYQGEPQRTVMMQADKIIEQRLEAYGLPVVPEYNAPVPTPVKVESEWPIIIYACMTSAYGCGAYTAIPVESWGREHYVATWPGQTVSDVVVSESGILQQTPKSAAPEILIIAAADNTEVRISPASSLADCHGCTYITLNAGEAYRVRSQVSVDTTKDVASDLTGTHILSTKPIGVISGNTRLMHDVSFNTDLIANIFQDMTVEWIPAVGGHGTEFVYTPTFDDRRQGATDDIAMARDRAFVRLITTEDDTSIEAEIHGESSFALTVEPLEGGRFIEDVQAEREAGIYRSSRPVLAVQSPGHSWDLEGWSQSTSNLLISSSWATYMSELVPREQWTSFAPIHTPALPDKMKHFLNVVVGTQDRENVLIRRGTDEPVPFVFNQSATSPNDYIWGTMQLEPGMAYYLIGRDGARFTGTVYGLRPGRHEMLADKEVVMDYREDLALSYGYPLAPSRCVLAGPDEPYMLESSYEGCGELAVRIFSQEDNPPGIRSLALVPDSSLNVRLVFVDPDDPLAFKSSLVDSLFVRLVPINPSLDAHGVLIAKTRAKAGQQFRIEYSYQADRLDFRSVEQLDFGVVRIGERSDEHELVFTNPLDHPVFVKQLRILFDTVGFKVLRTMPVFDWSSGADSLLLSPGDSLRVWVDLLAGEGRWYTDSLMIELGCGRTQLPLFGEAGYSCLNISSLDFSTLAPNAVKFLPFRICNAGTLPLILEDPVLTWESAAFSVSQAELDTLKGTELAQGECVTVQVKFIAGDVGEYQAGVRVWSNNDGCPDSVAWTGRVDSSTTSAPVNVVARGCSIDQPVPNPSSGNVRFFFRLGEAGTTRIALYDVEGQQVATVVDRHFSRGEHEAGWDASALPAGIYYVRIQSGEWSGSARLLLIR